MEIRILKYFLAVAQEESITKAAEILHTTQPNLSRQLNMLEAEVGKKLFERGSRKVTLTEEGMFLRKRAKEIIDLTERTESELSTYGETTSGDIYIGAPETYVMHSIAEIFKRMHNQYPNIKYHIFSGSTLEVSEQLNKGLLDFAILIEPIDLEKYNYLKLPYTDTWGVLMRKDSPLAKLNAITPEDIKDEPIFLAHQQSSANVLSGWFKEAETSFNLEIIMGSLSDGILRLISLNELSYAQKLVKELKKIELPQYLMFFTLTLTYLQKAIDYMKNGDDKPILTLISEVLDLGCSVQATTYLDMFKYLKAQRKKYNF